MRILLRSTALVLPFGLLALSTACTGGGGDSTSDFSGISSTEIELLLGQRIILGAPGASDVTLVDVDGDGLDDLMELNPFSSSLTVGLGIAPDEFVKVQSLTTAGVPFSFGSGDFDGDGIDEVAVVSLIGVTADMPVGNALDRAGDDLAALAGTIGRLSVYDWNPAAGGGVGELELANEFALPSYALTLSAGNLGHPTDSLLVPIPDLQSIYVYRDLGPGLEVAEILTSTGPTGVGAVLSSLVFDVDGDGLNDVLGGEQAYDGEGPGSVAVFLQNADGSFADPTWDLPAPRIPLLESAGDVDGDGTEDIAVFDLSGESLSVQLYLRGDDGVMADYGELFVGGRVSTFEVTDLDLDGQREALVGLLDAGQLMIMPLASEGKAPDDGIERIELGKFPRLLEVRQLGTDEFPDIVCGHSMGTTILRNDSDGTRGARGYSVPLESQFLRAGELDGDQFVDVVTVDLFQRSVAFLRGLPEGGYELAGEVPLEPTAAETPGSLALEDFDGDGDLDVAIAVYQSSEVRIMENLGALPFQAPDANTSYGVGLQPIGVDSGDLNGDGFPDMVVTLSGDRGVRVLLGDGELGFTALPVVETPDVRPLAVVVGDFDGDGNVDAAITTGEVDQTVTGVVVLVGDGTGELAPGPFVALPFLSTEITPADLDQDGIDELVCNQLGQLATAIQVLTSKAGLGDYVALEIAAGNSSLFEYEPAAVLVGDADGDLDDDLAVLTSTGRPIFLKNEGQLEFVETLLFGDQGQATIPFGVKHAQFVDTEGDVAPELLMLSPESDTLWFARGKTK
ncbi:FG-GAP repeat domain-containing protein [Engelhardtia mirabilis]|uniref:FG-GAP repeat protein n=1 Tax=Engelhardtia mirabilis TaxID=2528011 RepID=A0A518BMN4_9BACT|nr:FG-GAP repeat protein [Planctomycetes bacterium Pla133]QDV02567.1 FG-GAP repeat protein [Planctomycetes bacterium Pla86]